MNECKFKLRQKSCLNLKKRSLWYNHQEGDISKPFIFINIKIRGKIFEPERKKSVWKNNENTLKSSVVIKICQDSAYKQSLYLKANLI